MRRLGARLPPPYENGHWTQKAADLMVGELASLTVGPWGTVVGKVVTARVVEDEVMGHGLWVEVESEDA